MVPRVADHIAVAVADAVTGDRGTTVPTGIPTCTAPTGEEVAVAGVTEHGTLHASLEAEAGEYEVSVSDKKCKIF